MTFDRRLQPELMDDPGIDPAEHRIALRQLRRLNRVSLASSPIARCMLESTRSDPQAPIRILDVATGSGDVALGVAARLERAGRSIDLVLCDRSATALAVAVNHASAAGREVTTIRADVVAEGIALEDLAVDITMCSLFLHHLTRESAICLLSELRRVSSRAVVVADLRRCRWGLGAARVGGTLSGSRIVRIDASRSVEGAFTDTELLGLAEGAGLHGATAHRIFPWRTLVAWIRPKSSGGNGQ